MYQGCDNFISKVENFVVQKYSEDYLTGYPHAERVRQKALELQKKFGGDKEVIEISSLLHDIGLTQSYTHHVKLSAAIADGFLREICYPAEKREKVLNIIILHSKDSWTDNHQPELVEEKIVYDADKADVVYLRWLFKAYWILRCRGLNSRDALLSMKKILNHEISGVFFIQKEIEQKYLIIMNFLDELEKELTSSYLDF